MATFYSILSAQIRPEIQEKLSVGLLLIGPTEAFFRYSKNKLSAAKGLLTEPAYKILKHSVSNIQATAVNELSNSANELFAKNPSESNTFSIRYIEYLSRYNSNILTFSAPKQIDLDVTEEIFKSLYSKFVDDVDFKNKTKVFEQDTFEKFKAMNQGRLQKYFNIDLTVSYREIPSLIVPVKIDFLGKNDVPVFAQSIDFSKKIYHLENDLAQLFFLDAAFQAEKRMAKGFVIAEEPDKKNGKHHEVWEQLRKSKQFAYIPSSEQEQLLAYAEEHGVEPLIRENEEIGS